MTSPAGYDFDRDWPLAPADRDALRVLNRRGRVAIVYSQLKLGDQADPPAAKVADLLPASLPPDLVACVGRVRTLKEGLERVVRNVIANPHIDTLLLVGRDSKVFRPLRGLDCLLRHGTDAEGHILAPDQDEPVRRVLGRDCLVNLTPAEVAWFRGTGVRVVGDLLEKHADAGEAIPAAAERLASLPAAGGRRGGWDFADRLDIGTWRGARVVKAERTVNPSRGRFQYLLLQIAKDARIEDVILRVACPGLESLLTRIAASANLGTEKLLHSWLRWARPAGVTESESVAAAFALEEVLQSSRRWEPDDLNRLRRFESDGRSFSQDPWNPTHPWAAIDSSGARTGPDISSVRTRCCFHEPELSGCHPATLTPFTDDPKGWFITRVDYDIGLLSTDVFQNSRPGDPSTGKHLCTVVGERPSDIMATLLDNDWFGRHEQRLEHVGYVAIMLQRAWYALTHGIGFVQDKELDYSTRVNVDRRLHAAEIISGRDLADTWVTTLARLDADGLRTRTQKGRVIEGWCSLLHVPDMAAMTIPEGYPANEANIAAYAAEFVDPPPLEDPADYTYGDRMCRHFRTAGGAAINQLDRLARRLRDRPDLAHPGQRFDARRDLGRSHVPCLAFDVWFVLPDGEGRPRLHTLQITRSHDLFGAMPQNALGVARGWAAHLAGRVGAGLGDLVFLSTSNNIRVADDRDAMRALLGSRRAGGTVVRAGPAGEAKAVPLRNVQAGAGGQVEGVGGALVARWFEAPPGDDMPDPDRLAAAEAGTTDIARRLRDHPGPDGRPVDQVAVFAAHLSRALAKDPHYRTQYGMLSPRDAVADADAEGTDLLCLQLRNQLGRLHASAVFLNSARPVAEKLADVVAVQRAAVRMLESDMRTARGPVGGGDGSEEGGGLLQAGSVFVLDVLPRG